MTTTTRYTVAELSAIFSETGDLSFLALGCADVEATGAEWEQAVRVWTRLLGLNAGSDPALIAAARAEVLTDGELFAMLAGPASDFVTWFRLESWDHFGRSDGPDGDAWAWEVLDRARAGVQALGPMASQVPLRPVN